MQATQCFDSINLYPCCNTLTLNLILSINHHIYINDLFLQLHFVNELKGTTLTAMLENTFHTCSPLPGALE
jgi:hypothetical protein